jgi:hypothetical protein
VGPHGIVNGANGSETWCPGWPYCPDCVRDAEINARICAGEAIAFPVSSAAYVPPTLTPAARQSLGLDTASTNIITYTVRH